MIQFFHCTLFNNQYYLSQGFRAIFLQIFCEIAVRFFKKCFYYRAIIARQKSCEKLANRRAASDEKPTPDDCSSFPYNNKITLSNNLQMELNKEIPL